MSSPESSYVSNKRPTYKRFISSQINGDIIDDVILLDDA